LRCRPPAACPPPAAPDTVEDCDGTPRRRRRQNSSVAATRFRGAAEAAHRTTPTASPPSTPNRRSGAPRRCLDEARAARGRGPSSRRQGTSRSRTFTTARVTEHPHSSRSPIARPSRGRRRSYSCVTERHQLRAPVLVPLRPHTCNKLGSQAENASSILVTRSAPRLQSLQAENAAAPRDLVSGPQPPQEADRGRNESACRRVRCRVIARPSRGAHLRPHPRPAASVNIRCARSVLDGVRDIGTTECTRRTTDRADGFEGEVWSRHRGPGHGRDL
jgi:hypothetical protein